MKGFAAAQRAHDNMESPEYYMDDDPCSDCEYYSEIGEDACDYCHNHSLAKEAVAFCSRCDAPMIDGHCIEYCNED